MSNQAVSSLLFSAGKHKLLLDSNLLLLWLTAQYDLRLLLTFKRVQMFTQADAMFLAWIVDQFQPVVTTTHVVTEASNLGNSLSSYSRKGWFGLLAQFASDASEHTESLQNLSASQEFIPFGITDCALSSLSRTYQVLTTDHRLSSYAQKQGNPILNFNDLRKMI